MVIYRDGVGEGQIQHVKEQEVKVIKETLLEGCGGSTPRFTFIIVSKRINTRFFGVSFLALPLSRHSFSERN